MDRIQSETQRQKNDPAVVIETAEQRKVEGGRIKKRKKKNNKKKLWSKQLHKSMALEKSGSEGTLERKT